MKTQNRQKICYNCNAQVDLDVIVCPYCGTDLLEEFDSDYKSEEDTDSKALSYKQTIASLYPPPNQMQDEENMENDEDYEEKETEEEIDQPKGSDSIAAAILTVSLSLIGFSLLLFFFSKEGEITLNVNNKHLIVLSLISIPALLWSWRNLED